MNQDNLHEIIEALVKEVIPIHKTDCPLKRIDKHGKRHMMTEKLKELIKYYEQKAVDNDE